MLGPSLAKKLRAPHGVTTRQMQYNAADKEMR